MISGEMIIFASFLSYEYLIFQCFASHHAACEYVFLSLTYFCAFFQVLKQNMGIGGVISLLWFQRSLPAYVCKFFEMCLMVTADHGPAVSGAHNTIVCARAGKDLVSSLVSGLLTIVSMKYLLFSAKILTRIILTNDGQS